jgi:hypothetical protein
VTVILRLTNFEATILKSVLAYQHVGEYDGGPLWDVAPLIRGRRIGAALRIERKLDAAREAEGVKK